MTDQAVIKQTPCQNQFDYDNNYRPSMIRLGLKLDYKYFFYMPSLNILPCKWTMHLPFAKKSFFHQVVNSWSFKLAMEFPHWSERPLTVYTTVILKDPMPNLGESMWSLEVTKSDSIIIHVTRFRNIVTRTNLWSSRKVNKSPYIDHKEDYEHPLEDLHNRWNCIWDKTRYVFLHLIHVS